jgi:hypothetical protein
VANGRSQKHLTMTPVGNVSTDTSVTTNVGPETPNPSLTLFYDVARFAGDHVFILNNTLT